jgi:hypothetical protein
MVLQKPRWRFESAPALSLGGRTDEMAVETVPALGW